MSWLDGFKAIVDEHQKNGQTTRSEYITYLLLKEHRVFQDYLFIFLKRSYIKYIDSLSKKKPKIDESEIWLGQNNANYRLLVTPRFRNGFWENDKSEVRHFKPRYWSIGHILKTGLCIPGRNEKMKFDTINDYLNFFKNVLVRNSGSIHEMKIAELYCDYVTASKNPLDIALLIPEFRYEGIDVKHKYRLDFTIIESIDLNKAGFEFSPWSTHGYISKTKEMTQAEINEAAKSSFEREMKKHKDFFKQHGIFVLIYTDSDLANIAGIFNDMKNFLEPKKIGTQMQFHLYHEFFKD